MTEPRGRFVVSSRTVQVKRLATYINQLELALKTADPDQARKLRGELALVRPQYERLVEGL